MNSVPHHPITGSCAGLRIACLASMLLGVGILLGAFGSHGLKATSSRAFELWQTATLYLFINALGLLLIGGLLHIKWCNIRPALCLMMGIGIFCGTLYGMALGLPRWLGAITPIGGTLLAVGWGWLSIQLYRTHQTLQNTSY